ncbi:MAG: hypothetical protein LV480_06445 [Methylacidiphilales bacterium]|nr:hypothetical protein [Candidatus Methylacidiphilales bacterium]
MTESDFASRQLSVIRSLMERATVYRSISAPTALVGGLLSLGGFVTAYYAKHHRQHPLTPTEFLIVWLVILALTCLANAFFLSRGSALRGGPFFSPGMRCALTSVAPAFFAAAVMTPLLMHRPIQLALLWITLYGIGLLATQHFAPRSLVVLGMTFFFTGCGLLATWKHLFMPNPQVWPSALVVSGIMAATFGGYHLAYAAAVWALGEDRTESDAPVTGSENV